MARTRILPIVLPGPVYKRLEHEAQAAEREPVQQARWILKRALEDPKTPPRGPEAA